MELYRVKALATSFSVVFLFNFGNCGELHSSFEEEILQEKVVIGSRPLAVSAQKLIDQDREIEEMLANEIVLTGPAELHGLKIPIHPAQDSNREIERPAENLLLIGAMGHSVSKTSYDTARHVSLLYHTIRDFPDQNVIEIEDMSRWEFPSFQAAIARSWEPTDTVVITPKWGLFGSNYRYVMTNQDMGTSIDVNLFGGPIRLGSNTNWIVAVDPHNGQLHVTNGQGLRTIWQLLSRDLSNAVDWGVNDSLIFAKDNSWLGWFSGHEFLLINVDVNDYVRAKLVSSNMKFH